MRMLRGSASLSALLVACLACPAVGAAPSSAPTVAAIPAAGLPLPVFEQPVPGGALADPALLDALAAGSPQRAILVLDPAHESGVLDRLNALGIDHHLYDELHMASALVAAEALPGLLGVPGVVSIHPNEKMAPRLDQSADYVGARVVWDTYGYTGRGVTVMVMDSGVDGTHPDVRYRENLLENVVPTRESNGLIDGSKEGVVSSDPDGHGTHVAGVVAGTGRAMGGPHSASYVGIAWGSRLVGYQAGLPDDEGEISFESLTVLEGFNWALANRGRFSIDIVTNSWGANGDFDPRSPINLATLNLYKAGLLVVFAAGNEGDDGEHSLNKYGVAPWVLSVGAGDYFNQVPGFSSRGTDPDDSGLAYDHPDLVAPGVGITSARSVANMRGTLSASSYYASKSGTSMATPHVAGIAALLLEANPTLSPDDLMDILTATSAPMPRYDVWEAGAGFVNAFQAIRLAEKASGHRDEFLSGRVKYAGPASGDPNYARDAVSVGWLKGQAHRLRSPDKSAAEFVGDLVSGTQGHVFLVGTTSLLLLAFGVRSRDRRPAAAGPGRSSPRGRSPTAPARGPVPAASGDVPWIPVLSPPPPRVVARPLGATSRSRFAGPPTRPVRRAAHALDAPARPARARASRKPPGPGPTPR